MSIGTDHLFSAKQIQLWVFLILSSVFFFFLVSFIVKGSIFRYNIFTIIWKMIFNYVKINEQKEQTRISEPQVGVPSAPPVSDSPPSYDEAEKERIATLIAHHMIMNKKVEENFFHN
jgi:hypothetical protein